MAAARTGIWYACDVSYHSFDEAHKNRILELDCDFILMSEHTQYTDNDSEKDVAAWVKESSTYPRLMAGHSRANDRVICIYAAHRFGNGPDLASQAYNRIQAEIQGVDGFVVYHEKPVNFAGIPPVMDKLRERFKEQRPDEEPEFFAVEKRTRDDMTPSDWNNFYSNFWNYSNKTIFVSEFYNWRIDWSRLKRIEDFEEAMCQTAEDSKNWKTSERDCRWMAIVAAHREDRAEYYTPAFQELRFASLLPITLGAEGIAYFVFDWRDSNGGGEPAQDDIFRNSTTRQNISNLKPGINWLKSQLEPYSNPGYSGYKYNTTNGGWQSFPESDWLDRIQENQGDNTSWQKKLLVAFWKGYTGHEAWPVTSRDPWTGNYSYTAYFKQETHVIWDGDDKGNLTQFSFTMPPGDTKLLELWPTMW